MAEAPKPERPVRDLLMKHLSPGQKMSVQVQSFSAHYPDIAFGANVTGPGNYPCNFSLDVEVDYSAYYGEPIENVVGKQAEYMQEALEEWLKDTVETLNHKLYREIEESYEYLTGEEAVVESLDSNDNYFDVETGERVDMDDYVHIDQLPKEVAKKVCEMYSRMFGKPFEEVFDALVQNKVKFDHRGNRIDTDQYKLASELPDDVKEKVVERYRDWNVEDSWWADSVTDQFKDEWLKGWDDPQFEWSLFTQGSGARILSKYVDLKEFVPHYEQVAHKEQQRQQHEA